MSEVCAVLMTVGDSLKKAEKPAGSRALWVAILLGNLRKPAGLDSVELPDGFLERTHNRGVAWTRWGTL
ncbi:hypothetical protein E3N88_34881 [Mikania micrantha]|uniref:Uncharacterized protein n=1 Tax=Mikania micrantha TaxID=192012 RepID=A0A5N6LZM4_9ASTR|nr:hypothetical protein E3N88_34881 [Mikania micrantha]